MTSSLSNWLIRFATTVSVIAPGSMLKAQSGVPSIVPPGAIVESRMLQFGEEILVMRLPVDYSRADALAWGKSLELELLSKTFGALIASVDRARSDSEQFVEAGRFRFMYYFDSIFDHGASYLTVVYYPKWAVIGFPPLQPTKPQPKKFAHVDLPRSALRTANTLVPKGGVILASGLNQGTGLLLIDLPPGWSWQKYRAWKIAKRLTAKDLISLRRIESADLDTEDVLPITGLGSWGWAKVADGVNSEGSLKRALIGFPVDYQSRSVQIYQSSRKESTIDKPPAGVDDRAPIPDGASIIGTERNDGTWLTLVQMSKQWSLKRTSDWCLQRHLGAMTPINFPPPKTASDLANTMIPIDTETWGWADLYSDKTGHNVDRMVIGRPALIYRE